MSKPSEFDDFKYKLYKITNTNTLEAFVGHSKQAFKRVQEHLGHTDHNGSKLLRAAVEAFGEDTFMWAIIDGADTLDEVITKESMYIKRFNTLMPNGYNMSDGGVKGFKKHGWTPGQKQKVSGSNNSRSKLSEEKVIEILCDTRTRKEIAKAYGIGLTTVSDIKNRRKWKNVPLPADYVPLRGNSDTKK